MKALKRLLPALMLALCLCAPHARAQAATAPAASQLLVMLRLPPQHFHPNGYGGAYPNDGGKGARRRAAETLAGRHGLVVVDSWPMPVIGVDCYVMQVKGGGADAQAALGALAHEEQVLWAQPMQQFHGLQTAPTGDPLAPLQPAVRFWHIGELHQLSTGRGVRVALIDSAVDAAHPDLAGQVALQENFIEDGQPLHGQPPGEPHGTAVAGIIAARANNGVGIAGVAPGARLLALRACWGERADDTRCNSFTLGKALNFAVTHQADIINLSLGGPSDPLLRLLLDAARQRGMTVVAASDPHFADGGFPASYGGVLAVRAAGPGGGGPAAALRAPGADIPASLPGQRWGLVSGSSYAAAQVSGLLALMLELAPGTGPAQLRAAVVTGSGGTQLAHTGLAAPGQGGTGAQAGTQAGTHAGTIDACATIARLAGRCACLCSTPSASSATRGGALSTAVAAGALP
jgi:subtilisin family serine protease